MDGGWRKCQVCPVAIHRGKPKQRQWENIKEAIESYIESLQEDGAPIPDDGAEAFALLL